MLLVGNVGTSNPVTVEREKEKQLRGYFVTNY